MTSLRERLNGAPAWARRPLIPAFVLACAAAVSLSHGQPPPADRASGVSVPVGSTLGAPDGVGTLLLVTSGRVTRYDVATRVTSVVPLPAGHLALRAFPLGGTDVVLTVRRPPGIPGLPGVPDRPGLGTASSWDDLHSPPNTFAFAIPRTGAPVSLGAATAVIPGADWAHVWLLRGDVARLVELDGTRTTTWVRVPPGYRLVGTAGRGPLATIGGRRPLTVLLPADGGLPRPVVNAESLDLVGQMLLLRESHRVGTFDLITGATRWLPGLSAVTFTGPGALSGDLDAFATYARVNERARLVVGGLDATSSGHLRVVALDGGPARAQPPQPVWSYGRVLAVRPDNRVVAYRPGDRNGAILGPEFTATGIASTGSG